MLLRAILWCVYDMTVQVKLLPFASASTICMCYVPHATRGTCVLPHRASPSAEAKSEAPMSQAAPVTFTHSTGEQRPASAVDPWTAVWELPNAAAEADGAETVLFDGS